MAEVKEYIDKFKRIIRTNLNSDKQKEAMIASRVLSNLLYCWNQVYVDIELEDYLKLICGNVLVKCNYVSQENCIMFYDGFGNDIRGLAISYIKALPKNKYKIIYICPDSSKGRIEHIESELIKTKSEIIYISSQLGYVEKAKMIDIIFKDKKPKHAFLYTKPDDVAACIAFYNNDSSYRYLINLTDHAYWLGIHAADYFIHGREVGASISKYERLIDESKIVRLDCAPYINDCIDHIECPFNIYKDDYIFTGGALYKTFGDEDLLYYKTVSYILDKYPQIKFLYAGKGDDIELKKLAKKYNNRVFHIEERPDFFEILRNCKLYINSYPMFGGLMMRYAALAKKVPITLKHGGDSDGILVNQETLGIEFSNYEDYIEEINKLLIDDNYRTKKEDLVSKSVITEEDFARNLKLLIEEQKTEYVFDELPRYDTTQFREEFKKRYNKSSLYIDIAQKRNLCLFKYFPIEFIIGSCIRIKDIINGKLARKHSLI